MNRLESLRKRLEQTVLSKERDVAKRYAELYRVLHKLTGDYFERYEKGGKLDYQEMVKFNQLEKMLQEIHEIIMSFDKKLKNEIFTHLENHYKETYYQTSYIIETSSQAKIGYPAVRKEALDVAINNRFTGLTLNERLAKRRGDLIYSMRETITRGLVEGQTYRSMANIIKDELEGDLVKANRIVRTESKRIQETSNHESVLHAQSKGIIMKKTWQNVKDERSRPEHLAINGMTIPVDEKFNLDGFEADHPIDPNLPAKHAINCRCFLTYEVVKVEKPQHKELADLTYAEWRKERLR